MRQPRPRSKPHHRIVQVAGLQVEALAHLIEFGPSKLAEIAASIGARPSRVRYAMRTLHQDRKSYICDWDRAVGMDGCPRFAAIYTLGPEDDASMPGATPGLDWVSTQHLQPIYRAWTKTRTPDYPSEEG